MAKVLDEHRLDYEIIDFLENACAIISSLSLLRTFDNCADNEV